MRQENGDLFDAAEGRRLKEEGMAAAAAAKMTDLQLAQKVAVDVAEYRAGMGSPPTCCADDVFRILIANYGINTIGPAAGSIFKGERWEWTGRVIESSRTSNRRRLIRVWRLKP